MLYRRVASGLWSDPEVRHLSKEETLLFIHLITGERSHFAGIYYYPKELMIESKLSMEEVDASLKKLSEWVSVITGEHKPFVRYDDKLGIVWVVNVLKHHYCSTAPNNAKKSVIKQLKKLHGSELIAELLEHYKDLELDYEDDDANEDEIKNIHGEFKNVKLTSKQHDNLVKNLTEPVTTDYIEKLSAWFENNPKELKKKKNHYAVIQTWYRKDNPKGNGRKDEWQD